MTPCAAAPTPRGSSPESWATASPERTSVTMVMGATSSSRMAPSSRSVSVPISRAPVSSPSAAMQRRRTSRIRPRAGSRVWTPPSWPGASTPSNSLITSHLRHLVPAVGLRCGLRDKRFRRCSRVHGPAVGHGYPARPHHLYGPGHTAGLRHPVPRAAHALRPRETDWREPHTRAH